MTPADDARATWALLSETERAALAALDTPQIVTPHDLGRALGCSWQRAARTAGQLRRIGLVSISSLPKQTSYELTGQGAACLTVGLYGLTLAHVWKGLTWRGYDATRPAHERAERQFCARHEPHGDGPDRCGCGGLMCQGCGAHYPAAFLTELTHALDSSQVTG
jgi:hypothetical protein